MFFSLPDYTPDLCLPRLSPVGLGLHVGSQAKSFLPKFKGLWVHHKAGASALCAMSGQSCLREVFGYPNGKPH